MVLLNRGSSFYEVINIPRKLFPIFRKKQIWISLHTTDKKVASIRSCSIIAKVNARFLREEQMLNLTGFENNSDDDIDEVLSKICYKLSTMVQRRFSYRRSYFISIRLLVLFLLFRDFIL